MRNQTLLRIALMTVALGSCSGVKARSDFTKGTDFSVYKTYAWLPQHPTADVDEIVLERIRSAVDEELAKDGLQLVPAAQADLMVTQQSSVQEKVQVNDPYYSYDAYDVYEEGTLMIDLVDAKTSTLVWRGTGEARLQEDVGADEKEKRVKKVVSAILAKYPPS